MPKNSTLDELRDRLFDDSAELADLPPTKRDQILRYRAIFTLKLEKPHITNDEVAKMLSLEFGIKSLGQAYRDISATEVMLGNVRSSEKQWIRYLVVETFKRAIALSTDAENPKEMTAAASALAKYTRLDQEDQEPIPYEDIVPPTIEYLNDPKILGLPEPKEGAREYVERLKRKYIETQEVEYKEVNNEQ